jgi:ABC-type uncharacterized transport system fused permease/ATPase subunit
MYHTLILNNVEEISFAEGEQHEYDQLSKFFNKIIYVQKKVGLNQAYLEGATSFFSHFGAILTYLILSLSFFSGRHSGLSGAESSALIGKNAFFAMYLISCLTNILELADDYAKYSAHKTRIQKMSDYLGQRVMLSQSNIQYEPRGNDVLLTVSNLTIATPQNVILASNISFSVRKGEHCYIMGSNGVGKTSFARILSNLWLPNKGSISMINNPSSRPTSMFLPQKPFIATGSLLDTVTYPFWYSSLNETLQTSAQNLLLFIKSQVNFTSLKSHFDDPFREYTSMQYGQLSLGEAQKLSFLRILFWKPLLAGM